MSRKKKKIYINPSNVDLHHCHNVIHFQINFSTFVLTNNYVEFS